MGLNRTKNELDDSKEDIGHTVNDFQNFIESEIKRQIKPNKKQ